MIILANKPRADSQQTTRQSAIQGDESERMLDSQANKISRNGSDSSINPVSPASEPLVNYPRGPALAEGPIRDERPIRDEGPILDEGPVRGVASESAGPDTSATTVQLNNWPGIPAQLQACDLPDWNQWKWQMKHAIRSGRQLLESLRLPADRDETTEAEADFPTFVPPAFLNRIRPGDRRDPLLLQVLPTSQETSPEIQAGFVLDPVGEFPGEIPNTSPSPPVLGAAPDTDVLGETSRQARLIQKYAGRVLLITTSACGVHCRYCFRRHFPYPASPQNQSRWEPWLSPIARDPSLREVILSGGDPLVLTDESLGTLGEGLAEIPHVRWLRIHSRMPIVIPQRITPQFLRAFAAFPVKRMVVHANHASELNDEVIGAVQRLQGAGWQVLNQTVLLRGVNDQIDTLEALSVRLVETGIVPYYLHQLDRVRGAAHFEVPLARGRELIHELRLRLPGHAIPQYVQEVAGEGSKTPLA